MAIPMLKIRRPLGRLIFNMGIATPGKTVFLIETAPRLSLWQPVVPPLMAKLALWPIMVVKHFLWTISDFSGYVWLYSCISGYISFYSKYSWQTPHCSPVRVRYGVSAVSSKSAVYCNSVCTCAVCNIVLHSTMLWQDLTHCPLGNMLWL